MFSIKIDKAIRKIFSYHKNQLRIEKELIGKEIPYISHPFGVALILLEHNIKDENLIVSAILHDILEDTDYTPKDLEKDFGKEIKEIVKGVSLKKKNYKNQYQKLKSYLEMIKKSSLSSLIIATADKIHNIKTILIPLLKKEKELTKEWKNTFDYFNDFLKILEERGLGNNKLTKNFIKLLKELERTKTKIKV
jgi:GTP pyrophosphokinase